MLVERGGSALASGQNPDIPLATPKAAIPAKAGIQSISGYFFDHSWTPAFAGVTT